jgi:hypothetical protein
VLRYSNCNSSLDIYPVRPSGTSWHGFVGLFVFSLFLLQFTVGWAVKLKNNIYRSNVETNPHKSLGHVKLIQFHHLVAAVICLFLPLTIVLGVVHGTGITPDDSEIGNTAAHLCFGGALVLGGLYLFWMNTVQDSARFLPRRVTPLQTEYIIWFFFGLVIIWSQHDWLKEGLLSGPGVDTQHVLIGVLATITSICGLTFVNLNRKNSAQISNKQMLRLPLAVLYFGLGTAMITHTQANSFASTMHVAFGTQVMLQGLLVLLATNAVVNVNNTIEAVPFQPGSTNQFEVSAAAVEDAREYETLKHERHAALRCLLFVSCGVTFAGSSRYSAIGASRVMHAPIYILMLISIALAILTWFAVILHHIQAALTFRKNLLAPRAAEKEANDKSATTPINNKEAISPNTQYTNFEKDSTIRKIMGKFTGKGMEGKERSRGLYDAMPYSLDMENQSYSMETVDLEVDNHNVIIS